MKRGEGIASLFQRAIAMHPKQDIHPALKLGSLLLLFVALSACAGKPPVVSADTSCERFAHISFSDAQIKAVAADWTLWESVADQVVAHNIQYDAHCMEVLKEGK